MIILLWSAGFVSALSPAVSDPVQRNAAQQCEPGISRAVQGEISTGTITEFRRFRRQTILKGTLTVLQRPAVRPGEMTPTHVINVSFSYDCRITSRSAAKVRVNRLQN